MPFNLTLPSSLPNPGYANLTAVAVTSSLYLYLFAQQQKLEREQAEAQAHQISTPPPPPPPPPQQQQQQKIILAPEEQKTRKEEEIRRQAPPTSTRSTARRGRNSNHYKMSKTFSPSEVANHKDAENGMYIIIDENVYDVTNFIDEHPGGSKILKRVAGKDASKQFWKYHNEGVLKKYSEKLKVGTVGEKAKL